ncbi:unnamed protein product [Angiostrongylus costaricensis]|uniref:ABC transporter domain-containing protein n=1 Tax=Angiostrongylus costaricensis TaxID=334426 RepID=A0A158PKV2_ANGCS|nr:unnamed protein product [Angiostrongylus costaricensis]
MYGNLPSDFDTFVKDVLDFQIVFTKKFYNTDYDISTNLREAIVVPSGGQQLRRWTSIFTTVCFLVWCLLFFLSLITPYADTKSSLIYVLNLNPLAAYKTFYDITVTYHIRGASDLVLTTPLYYDCLTPFEIISYLVVSCLLMIVYLILYEADWCSSYSSLDTTVLFGHSGSGKTTLAKLITGEAKMNCGSVSVMSATKRNNHGYQNGIGYCPQKNVLFDCLTVLDHLWFFNSVKNGPINWLREAINVARAVGLYRLLNVRACELSGVQRRFLGIAVALVGGSHLVVIDEPIQHSDPEIKSRFKEIIKSEKDSRCILISTSSAETTDLVGDRILVLQSGRILASGSRSFLKNKFGCDYILSISLDDQMTTDYHKDCVTLFVRALIPDAELRETFDNSFVFGFSSEELDVQIALYREFQVNRVLLGISDFHIRRCTLADVIHKIETTKEDGDSEKTIKNSVADRARDVSLGIYEHGRFLVFDPHDMKELTLPIVTALSAFPEIEVVLLRTTNFCKEWPNDWPFVIGAVAIGNEIGLWNFDDDTCSLHMATPSALHNPRTVNSTNNEIWVVPNISIYGYPSIVQLLTKVHLGNGVQRVKVRFEVGAFEWPLLPMIVANSIGIAHVLLGCSFVIVPIQERRHFFKQQQFLSGLSLSTYWLTNLVFDAAIIFMMVSMFTVFFIMPPINISLIFLIILYAYVIGQLPAVYSMSLFFRQTENATIFLTTLTVCYPFVLNAIFPTKWIDVCCMFLPTLAFFRYLEESLRTEKELVTRDSPLLSFAINFVIFALLLFTVELRPQRFRNHRKAAVEAFSIENKVKKSQNFNEFATDNPENDFSPAMEPMVLRGVPLVLHPGEIVGIFGEKRNTRSIIMRILSNYLCPLSHIDTQFSVKNINTVPVTNVIKEIGFCPRHDSLHPLLSPRRNLEIVATIAGRSSAIDKDNFIQVAMRNIREPHREFGLHSPMERRRACVTAALLSRSKVLVFDQPTEMVDYKTRIFIWEAIKEARKSGRAVVIVTDSVEECETLCNRIGIISDGAELLTIGTVSELRAKYGMFVVIELYPLTKSDKRKATEAISQAFPKARLLQQSSSDPGKLKWKLPIAKEEDIPQLMEELKNLLLSVSVRDGSLMKASLQELISNAHELIQMSIE